MKFDIIDTSAGSRTLTRVNTIDEVVNYFYNKSMRTNKTQYANPTEWYFAEKEKTWLFMDDVLKCRKVNFTADDGTEWRDLPVYQVLKGWVKI